MKKTLFLALLSVILFSCKNENNIKNVERAFYYWKTSDSRLQEEADSILKTTNTKKLYVKFFEVEHNELMGNIPFSKNRMNIYDTIIEIVPTVFIKNEVFLKSSFNELDLLADNINFLINKYKVLLILFSIVTFLSIQFLL